jgi:hypothetical protein
MYGQGDISLVTAFVLDGGTRSRAFEGHERRVMADPRDRGTLEPIDASDWVRERCADSFVVW